MSLSDHDVSTAEFMVFTDWMANQRAEVTEDLRERHRLKTLSLRVSGSVPDTLREMVES